jgi:hypothetical protein
MTTLADDLLLVLLDPVSGKPRTDGTRLDYGLAGALLLELALDERVDIVGPKPGKAEGDPPGRRRRGRRGARRRRSADRAEAPDVRQARPGVGQGPARAAAGARRAAGGTSAGSSSCCAPTGGRRPTTRDGNPGVAPARRADDRCHPRPRTAALVALLAAVDAAPAAVDAPDRATRKAVSRRADQISEGAWAAESVRRAVKAAQAAVAASTAAIVAATTVASS